MYELGRPGYKTQCSFILLSRYKIRKEVCPIDSDGSKEEVGVVESVEELV